MAAQFTGSSLDVYWAQLIAGKGPEVQQQQFVANDLENDPGEICG